MSRRRSGTNFSGFTAFFTLVLILGFIYRDEVISFLGSLIGALIGLGLAALILFGIYLLIRFAIQKLK